MSKYFNLQTIITSAIVALIIVIAVVSMSKVYSVDSTTGKITPGAKATGKLSLWGSGKAKPDAKTGV